MPNPKPLPAELLTANRISSGKTDDDNDDSATNNMSHRSSINKPKINHFTRDALKSILSHQREMEYLLSNISFASSAVTQFRKRKLCRLSVNWGLSTKSKRKMQHRLNAKLTTCFIVLGLICSLLFPIVLFAFFLLSVGKETISTRQILSVPFASGDWLNSELEI